VASGASDSTAERKVAAFAEFEELHDFARCHGGKDALCLNRVAIKVAVKMHFKGKNR
jgi:hypothetical protein